MYQPLVSLNLPGPRVDLEQLLCSEVTFVIVGTLVLENEIPVAERGVVYSVPTIIIPVLINDFKSVFYILLLFQNQISVQVVFVCCYFSQLAVDEFLFLQDISVVVVLGYVLHNFVVFIIVLDVLNHIAMFIEYCRFVSEDVPLFIALRSGFAPTL